MRFKSLKTLVFVVSSVALIAGSVCAADKPIKTLADVKGTWTGTASGPKGGSEKVTITIKDDGSWSASSWSVDSGGTGKLADGKFIWKGSRGNTGSATLTEDGELAISVDAGQGFGVLKRKQK